MSMYPHAANDGVCERTCRHIARSDGNADGNLHLPTNVCERRGVPASALGIYARVERIEVLRATGTVPSRIAAP